MLWLISSFKQRDVGEIFKVGTSIYYSLDSQTFDEVLDIFPGLSYRLTFIMLSVTGMTGFTQTWQIRVITFFRINTSLCLFSSQGKLISLMDIHVQHLASLCRIFGDKIKDHKRKVDTNCFVSEIHEIWKDLLLLDSPNVHPELKKKSKKEGKFQL